MHIENQTEREGPKRRRPGRRGKRKRPTVTPLRDDSDDPEYTDTVLDGRHHEPEEDE